MAWEDRKGIGGSAEPIEDGDLFREAVVRHSGERWPVLEHLESITGILAGPDGPASFGIFCRHCTFGIRSDGSSAAALRERFAEAALDRTCEHWSVYLEHPAAFFGEI